MLREAHVAVVPGVAFGEAGEGYVRLSFATSDELLARRGRAHRQRVLGRAKPAPPISVPTRAPVHAAPRDRSRFGQVSRPVVIGWEVRQMRVEQRLRSWGSSCRSRSSRSRPTFAGSRPAICSSSPAPARADSAPRGKLDADLTVEQGYGGRAGGRSADHRHRQSRARRPRPGQARRQGARHGQLDPRLRSSSRR